MVNTKAIGNFINYFVKPGKSLLVNKNTKAIENFTCTLGKGKETEAALGDVSLWIESMAKSQLGEAKAQVGLIFGDLHSVESMSNRAKGALSINTKVARELKNMPNQTYTSFQEAAATVGDAIGSRVITKSLDKLSSSEIESMISNTMLNGEKLTSKQVHLLRNYIYQKPISKSSQNEAFRLFEEFAKPLVEKRSQEVVDQLSLSILKHRMLNEGLTIEKIKSKGFFDDNLIKRLETEEIIPLNITMINNYRGKYGLSEFSNNQIHQLADALNFQKTDGKLFKIYSDPRGLDRYNYSIEEVAKQSTKSIKASGYRTAQMNVIHSNGARGEIQFRGEYTNMIGEYEHIAYDLRQGKNTLGPNFDEFKAAISKLSERDYNKYNKYLEECYNYYNRLELGLPAVKPKLPKRFNKVLSEESMKKLHDENEVIQKQLDRTFNRYFEAAA